MGWFAPEPFKITYSVHEGIKCSLAYHGSPGVQNNPSALVKLSLGTDRSSAGDAISCSLQLAASKVVTACVQFSENKWH